MKNSASAAMMTTTTRISTKPSLECESEASRRALPGRGERLLQPALTFHPCGEAPVRSRPRLEDAPERRAHRGDVLDEPHALEGRDRGPTRGTFARAAHHQRAVERVRQELHEPRKLQQRPAG